MKKSLLPLLLGFLLSTNFAQALTFVNYVGFENPNVSELVIWINADTNFGEGVQAQIRYGSPFIFSGFVTGEFNDTDFPGANWKVTVSYPSDVSSVDVEVAGCTDFNNCSTSGTLFSGFVNTISFLSLPVELTRFELASQKGQVSLEWETASEWNNSHFEVERSADSRNWELLDVVAGHGQSFVQRQYEYTDKAPLKGANYYRLRQVDFNGGFDYSEIVTTSLGAVTQFRLYPNPTSSFVQLETDVTLSEEVEVLVFNALGQLILQTPAVFDQQTPWQLEVGELIGGMYQLQVRETSQGRLLSQQTFFKL
ncbi:MAG: T9SS type A sorting domain-containing protein [Bacteroidota bacterium]